jgi:hypothetical protein
MDIAEQIIFIRPGYLLPTFHTNVILNNIGWRKNPNEANFASLPLIQPMPISRRRHGNTPTENY